jgi:hypothetical protein
MLLTVWPLTVVARLSTPFSQLLMTRTPLGGPVKVSKRRVLAPPVGP